MNARRLHHCRGCRRETEQTFLYAEPRVAGENGRHPKIEWYRCVRCELVLSAMADVSDTEGLLLHVMRERFGRRHNGLWRESIRAGTATRSVINTTVISTAEEVWLDLEDALGHLRAQILVVFRQWDPGRGVPFTAYATGQLRNDLVDWIRSVVGKGQGGKPHATAVALDGLGAADDDHPDGGSDAGDDRGALDALLPGGVVDGDADRDPALEWAVVRRHRELERMDGLLGLLEDARPPARA